MFITPQSNGMEIILKRWKGLRTPCSGITIKDSMEVFIPSNKSSMSSLSDSSGSLHSGKTMEDSCLPTTEVQGEPQSIMMPMLNDNDTFEGSPVYKRLKQRSTSSMLTCASTLGKHNHLKQSNLESSSIESECHLNWLSVVKSLWFPWRW